MGDRVILHSDINCCYASIEHLHHPELAGKPLAVGGDPEARHGIVLTADYIAKKYGVKTGMALWQAKQICPDITFVYSNKKGLKAELGSDRLLGVPLETYIPSEKLAIESGSADENIEIMKAYMCKQRGIRLIKLPMKGTELDYANNLKKAFQSVHIFISSDTEEDVEIIKNTFERWRESQ